ncbi:protein IN CHLOROPLAST ATPASE BIOGENESIS, chloroplastic-like [Silene latifolia]|uniref:protein IN CHLOROPLAST ATPASE BIOGENESIS, chloroplastic-like n=1 Tax=Silene latifolia TaxID=37657 RepID=UPI003D780467
MMKAGVVGIVQGGPYATIPRLRRRAPSVLCFSSSGHITFIKDIALTQPPEHLHQLLNVLKTKGETIVSPGARQGLIPLAIPLSEKPSGTVTALLRWPTAPPGMEMPVVEVHKHGVWLLAKNVDQYIHRILVEEDVSSQDDGKNVLFDASLEAGEKLYKKGDYTDSQTPNLDSYLLKMVGLFPDILERKVMRHFDDGDHVSALVTGEFYMKKDLFPGFARPYVFNAKILLRVGQVSEAKDAARVALKSPWWTLGCPYQEVADMAQWEDEQIEYIKEKVTEEGRQDDLKKGKDPLQVALDEAAFLLDLASIDGSWDECWERVAECYKEGGLTEIAQFISYRD